MNKPNVITYSGVTVDLSKVKCFKVNGFSELGKNNIMIIEFKTYYDFILNPSTGEYEKQEYKDKVEVEFPRLGIGICISKRLAGFSANYLDEQEESEKKGGI